MRINVFVINYLERDMKKKIIIMRIAVKREVWEKIDKERQLSSASSIKTRMKIRHFCADTIFERASFFWRIIYRKR